MKKVVNTFWEKISDILKKSTDDWREESITEDPEEELITKDSKRTLSLRNLKSIWRATGASGFSITFTSQKALFVMVYDRVGDEDKFWYDNFALGKPPRLAFSRYSHVKIEAKEFIL